MALLGLKNKAIVRNLRVIKNINIPLNFTVTTTNDTNILVNKVRSSPFGSLLHSFSESIDGTGQADFLFYVSFLSGVWTEFSHNSSVFDEVPSNVAFLIPPNTDIVVKTYNYNGATSNGNLSVVAVLEDLTSSDQKEVDG